MSAMAAAFQDQTFLSAHPAVGRLYEGLRFERCFFDNCGVSPNESGVERTRLRNIAVVDCRVWACHVYWAVVEDALVDGLKTDSGGGKTTPFRIEGAALKHVVLRGKIGSMAIAAAARIWRADKPSIFVKLFQPAEMAWRSRQTARRTRAREIDAANVRFYQEIDWALDIREAQFYSVTIQGVPSNLIRRDVATQAVITRSAAERGLGDALERFPQLGDTYWPYELDRFLRRDSAQDLILVAPKRHPKYKQQLDGIKMLREAGVADPE